MSAISLGVQRGFGTGINDASTITPGTNAPSGTFDMEFRFNQTDQLSKHLTSKDLVLALKAFIRVIEQQGGNVNLLNLSGGATIIGPPG